ncbi:MAG: alanine racemase [Flavobacteriaceae bacterium]|nr:alanine racemase [Flavobacteriaceae bacterium]MCB0485358.1 alanine racemase [Flavobacteriaceae bacterium]
MGNIQETVLEIDLNALKHNFEFIKSKLKNNTKILAVVKAYGYGTDAAIIASHLEKLNVDYFAVAYAKEGVDLRNVGVKKPILVLHPQPINFQSIIDNCLEPNIYSKRILEEFIHIAEVNHLKEYPIHIKFNTGLNRLGFKREDIIYILSKLQKTTAVKVTSLFSHLVASEDLNEKDFSLNQINTFKEIALELTKTLNYKPMLHMLNTSGIMNYPEAQFNMVRAGISLYGFANEDALTKQLRNVVSLKSVISQIHHIKKGESVGYNRGFITEKDIVSATIPIGHADGIHRAFGKGKGFVTIKGKKAPILGNVCMDMVMVDITNIECNEGDEVTIFDNQDTVNELASNINSIPYEILTAISQRVKRIVK